LLFKGSANMLVRSSIRIMTAQARGSYAYSLPELPIADASRVMSNASAGKGTATV
jgi:hypothetical protein